MFKSSDAASSWIEVNAGLASREVRALAVSPVDSNEVLAGTWGGGVALTASAGASWAVSNTGLRAVQIMTLTATAGTSPTLYAGAWACGLFRSRDLGQTWTPVNNGFTTGYVSAIAVEPDNPNVAFAALPGGGLYRTADGADTWQLVATPWSSSAVEVEVVPGASNTVYVGTWSGVFRSLDGGDTFSAAGLDGENVTTIGVMPSDPLRVLAGTVGGRLWLSHDGGTSWTLLWDLGGGNVRAIVFNPADPAVVLAGVESFGVYRSQDAGATWSQVLPYSVWGLTFVPWSPGTVYGVGMGQPIVRSADAGQNWEYLEFVPNIDARAVVAIGASPLLYVGTSTQWTGDPGVYVRGIDDGTFDTTPPVIRSVTASPAVLWPPNHKMVGVTVSVDAVDNSGSPVTSEIVSVTSNEPDDGLGDGDTAGDIRDIRRASVRLRAERSGLGDGRLYTITVRSVDAHGNAATATVGVSVPKS